MTQSESFASAITDRPMLVAPDGVQLFGALIRELAQNEEFTNLYAEEQLVTASAGDRAEGDDFWNTSLRPYNVKDGILQIPIMGVLLNRFSYQFGRWATGYQYIEAAFMRGMADPEVRGIAFVENSGGGEVAGNFELVEKLAAGRGEKPIRAYAADHAYSAAYSIATAADSITMTRSGGVGSVGVVTMHVSMEKMLKEWGIEITFIYAGKHKVDGNSYEKLSESAKARIQNRVDRIYGEFVALVAENRDMEEQAVRDTEALTYDASEALEVGFADKVGALEEEMAIFAEEADTKETEFMADKQQQNPSAEGNEGVTQAAHEAAVASARTEGANTERARVSAILGSDEAKTRPTLAMKMATGEKFASLDAETIIGMMADMPEETAEASEPEQEETPKGKGQSGFDAAMAESGNPEVGADGGAAEGEGEQATASEQMLEALAAVSGKKRKAA